MIAEQSRVETEHGAPGERAEAGRRFRLRELEQAAVGWLARHTDCFDPLRVPEPERTFAHKALVELALLLSCRVRLDPEPLSEDYAALLAHVAKVAARPSYRDLPARDHGALLLYGLTYASLRVCGREDLGGRAVLERTMASRFALIRERIPFRQLDLAYLLELGGFARGAQPTLDEIFPQTLLAGDPNVVEMTDVDAYAVTHALFYLTDFGRRAPRWPAAFDPLEAVRLVEALLVRFRGAGHTDLTGELIASLVCLGVRRSPEIDHGWLALRRAQAADGHIPGPPGVIDEAGAEAPGGPRYRDWKVSYHTTMVVAIAAVMSRRAEEGEGYPAVSWAPAPAVERPDRAPVVRGALEQAAGWLALQAGSADLTAALRAAAGLALVSDALGPVPAAVPALIRLAQRLDADPGSPLPWEEAGADTLLRAACLLRELGIPSQRLHEELEALASSLDAELLAARPALAAPARLLARAGALDPGIVEAALAKASHPLPRRRPGEAASTFALRLTQGAGGAVCRRSVREWLTCELIGACRDYRLDEAAVILRALLRTGPAAGRVVRDAADYLLSQQTPDGAFGYLAQDEESAASTAARLNITLSALWALSEIRALYRDGSPTSERLRNSP
jgi:hypothetical protein